MNLREFNEVGFFFFKKKPFKVIVKYGQLISKIVRLINSTQNLRGELCFEFVFVKIEY